MLKCNAKIWAIVVLICLVMQFITVSMPTISETFAQMDIEFEQRAEEERTKATASVSDDVTSDVDEQNAGQ